MAVDELGFPLWIRLTHFFNFFFMLLLIRSGIEILGAHPKLYWNDDALPGSEWLRATKKQMPRNRLWTAEDETQPMPSWLALPGQSNLGLGRHWHFWSVTGWLLTGLIYVVLLFTSPQWRRLIPTSWNIFSDAWQSFLIYLHFQIPPEGNPFNPIQQLTYFALIFGLAPLQIVTGIVMSPALAGRFPWLLRIFGGRQAARSLHFLGMISFVIFIVIHLILVVCHGFGREMAKIVLGDEAHSHTRGLVVGLAVIGGVAVFHLWATGYSLRHRFKTKKLLEIGIDPLWKFLFHSWRSRQNYSRISSFARVNGRPPQNETYQRMVADQFKDWRLEIRGLVHKPLNLSLDDLRQMPFQTQTTLHTCIQGWSYLARWSGVPLSALLEKCQPLAKARYLVFYTLDEKAEVPSHGWYYEVIDLAIAVQPQTLLAYEMNGQPLPIPHGAPLRLRTESQLGYKMAKWINAIELVETFDRIGRGQGGWRDDLLNYYPSDAGI